MLRLSIIIPCLETDGRLDDTLASVLQNRPEACEVIVVHRGRYDDPYELASEVVFHQSADDESLVDLLNRGLALAQAPIVHLLACGGEVEDGWTDRAVRRFDDERVAAVAPLLTTGRFDDGAADAQPVQTGIVRGRFERSRPLRQTPNQVESAGTRPLGPSLAAGFYRAQSLRDVGGFEPSVGADLADLDVALRFAALGLRCVVETTSRVTHADGGRTADSAFAAGQAAERVFWRHVFSRHGGGVAAALLHPLAIAADCLVQLPRGGALRRLAGRLSVLTEAAALARRGMNRTPASPQPIVAPKGPATGTSRRIDLSHNRERRSGRGAEKFVQ
ncbi:MAG: hypothetical protein RIC55_36325 [Pirellulaceae bacterium]